VGHALEERELPDGLDYRLNKIVVVVVVVVDVVVGVQFIGFIQGTKLNCTTAT